MPDRSPSLVLWLKGNIIATLVLTLSIVGSVGGAVWSTSRWVSTYEDRVANTQRELLATGRDVTTLQGNIVSLDDRVNKLSVKLVDLHNLSDQVSRDLKARLDTIDALARYNTERASQAPLPGAPRR